MSETGSNGSQNVMQSTRVLVIGLVAVVPVLGLGLVAMIIGQNAVIPATTTAQQPEEKVDALANSQDECVVCHKRTTPGIVQQYGHSTMAAAESTSTCGTIGTGLLANVGTLGLIVLLDPKEEIS